MAHEYPLNKINTLIIPPLYPHHLSEPESESWEWNTRYGAQTGRLHCWDYCQGVFTRTPVYLTKIQIHFQLQNVRPTHLIFLYFNFLFSHKLSLELSPVKTLDKPVGFCCDVFSLFYVSEHLLFRKAFRSLCSCLPLIFSISIYVQQNAKSHVYHFVVTWTKNINLWG